MNHPVVLTLLNAKSTQIKNRFSMRYDNFFKHAAKPFLPFTGTDVQALAGMGASLNSHTYTYKPTSGQNATQRMYQGAGGVDLDNQQLLSQQRSTFKPGNNTAIGRAVQQISLFTGKQSYGSDVRTNKEKFPELHHLLENADSSKNPELHRGIVIGDKTHGTADVSTIFKPGSVFNQGVTSTSSDTNLARDWVLDDKTRIDAAKASGDHSVLDDKYGGSREFSFVNLHFPAGSQALQVAPLSEVPEHNEYALAAGKFKVGRVEGPDSDGIHHVFLEHHEGSKGTTASINWAERYTLGRIAGVLDCPCGQGPAIQKAGKTLTGLLDHRSLYPTHHPEFPEHNEHVRTGLENLIGLHVRAGGEHQREIASGSPVSESHQDHMRAHDDIKAELWQELNNPIPFPDWQAHE